jgi:hypothetical protein
MNVFKQVAIHSPVVHLQETYPEKQHPKRPHGKIIHEIADIVISLAEHMVFLAHDFPFHNVAATGASASGALLCSHLVFCRKKAQNAQKRSPAINLPSRGAIRRRRFYLDLWLLSIFLL